MHAYELTIAAKVKSNPFKIIEHFMLLEHAIHLSD
jgi:hypothetical protein